MDSEGVRNSEALAWAAGLFEGEGCFALDGHRRPRALINMTDEDIVRRFAHVMGFGTLRTKIDANPKYKKQWLWSANSRAEFELTVSLLGPWLGKRRMARAHEIRDHLLATDWFDVTCEHCGKTVSVERKTSNSNKRFCSRQCKTLAYQKRNADKRREYLRAWRARNPGKDAEYSRRARERALERDKFPRNEGTNR